MRAAERAKSFVQIIKIREIGSIAPIGPSARAGRRAAAGRPPRPGAPHRGEFLRGGTFSDAWIGFAHRSDAEKNCPKKIFRPSSRALVSHARPAPRRRETSCARATARAQIQHLEAKLLNLAGTQNAGVARSDAGLRAELRADLDRAVARLATLQGGPATGGMAATARGAARQEGSNPWGGGGSSGSSGGGASSSADVGGPSGTAIGSSAERPDGAGRSGTQPTQHAPEDEEDETDELIAMALYDDDEEEDFDDGHYDLMRASSAPWRRRIAA